MLLKKQLPSVKKLLRRKTIEREVISPKTSKVLQKSPSSRRMSDVPEGVIRVHAPLLSKVSMAIQLTSHTKAKDILAKFQYENSHGSSECFKIQNQRLYEIGGNIGQHCLDPDAYILDIYHVNPQAEWVIKPQPSFWNNPQDGTYHVLYAKKILHLVGKITRLFWHVCFNSPLGVSQPKRHLPALSTWTVEEEELVDWAEAFSYGSLIMVKERRCDCSRGKAKLVYGTL